MWKIKIQKAIDLHERNSVIDGRCAICTEELRGRQMTDNGGGLKRNDYSLRKYEQTRDEWFQ